MVAPIRGQEGAVWEGPCVRGYAWAFLRVYVFAGRERPPCEGFIPSVTAEGSEVKIWVFPGVSRVLPRHGQEGVPSGFSAFVQKRHSSTTTTVINTIVPG